MSDFVIKQHATLPRLDAILRRGSSKINLTGATVKLVLRPRQDPGNETLTRILDAVIVDDGSEALRGQVYYDFTSNDTSEEGDFLGNWHVKFSDDSVDVVPTLGSFTIVVEPAPDAFA